MVALIGMGREFSCAKLEAAVKQALEDSPQNHSHLYCLKALLQAESEDGEGKQSGDIRQRLPYPKLMKRPSLATIGWCRVDTTSLRKPNVRRGYRDDCRVGSRNRRAA
jgi:hypothetical protein